MKTFLFFLGVCLCFLPKANGQLKVRVLQTFDYPGAGNSTMPTGISNKNNIVGNYLDESGVSRGFLRLRTGQFPIVPLIQKDPGYFAEGINSSNTFCGYETDTPITYGFLYTYPGHTSFIVEIGGGSDPTYIFGINDAGDYVGSIPGSAFIQVSGGPLTTFTVPGSSMADGFGINSLDEIVGQYFDPPPATTFHGYLRDTHARLTYPIDFPGAISTALLSINDSGLSVGRWLDAGGVEHGLLLRGTNTFVSFDYPGATGTSLNGINNVNVIVGRYTDDLGISHGFVARVTN